MHSPEYTAQIKELIQAKGAAEDAMKRILFQFRNGRKPDAEDIVDARKKWAEALAVVDPEHEKSVGIVIDAAEKWQSELTTYIIPSDESYGEDLAETAEGHTKEADEIGIAIERLTGKSHSQPAKHAFNASRPGSGFCVCGALAEENVHQ